MAKKFSILILTVFLLFSESGHTWVATHMRRRTTVNAAALPAVNLTISANTQNYNVFTAAGSPTSPVAVTLTINAGVLVGSATTASPAMDTGTFPATSTLTIINNGKIIGAGGNGGAGGDGASDSSWGIGTMGSPGGPALTIHLPVTIQNNGSIWGGGGGGGGGFGGGDATFNTPGDPGGGGGGSAI